MNTIIKAAVAALGLNFAALGAADAQNADSAANIARSLAASMDTSQSKAVKDTVTFLGATSHENIVEMNYETSDTAVFAQLKAAIEVQRTTLTSYFCNAERGDMLKMGVIVNVTTALQDSSDLIETTIDQTACEQLPVVQPVDAGTLAVMAEDIAAKENENQSAGWTPPFQAAGVVAHDNIVESRVVILDASLADDLKADTSRTAARVAGNTCPVYLTEIKQGIAFHDIFVLQGGAPVLDITIDRSAC